MRKRTLGLAALTSLLLAGTALAEDKIKVGVTATLEGTYTILGVDGIARLQRRREKIRHDGRRQGARIRHRLDRRDARIRRCAPCES